MSGFLSIAPDERAALVPVFADDRPGPRPGQHAIATGSGFCCVDRWPQPRVVAAGVGHDVQLAGDASRFDLELMAQAPRPAFVAGNTEFAQQLRRQVPDLFVWDRVIYAIREPVRVETDAASVRRLEPADQEQVENLEEDIEWIHSTHGGPAGITRSRVAYGAFVDGALASIAVPYHIGARFEDLGVVTASAFRGRGLSTACASMVVQDVSKRGRIASWSTSPDNIGSIRVAEKLGGRKERDDFLYIVSQKE